MGQTSHDNENKSKYNIIDIENEAKILKSINSDFVVKYYESFIEQNYFNIVMEYCENSDLGNFIKAHKSMNKLIDERVIFYISLDICSGIQEIHSKNLIHRDLKPDNLFISKDFKIKIGDFGISKQLTNTFNYAKTTIGTFTYIAPEILKGEKYNKKVDIWALGCILYELFSLNKCFDCSNIAGLINQITYMEHGKIDTHIYNIEWQI